MSGTFVMMMAAGARKPYKRRVAYLESTGTQWIDTGVTSVAGVSEYFIRHYKVNSAQYALFGAGEINNVKQFSGVPYYNANLTNRLALGTANNVDLLTETVGWHDYRLNVNTATHEWSITYDGAARSGSFAGDTMLGASIYLLAMNSTSNKHIAKSGVKLSSFAVTQNGSLVRDFIPVIDWNDRPAMYDKVSGQFFYNQGTGEFNYA